MPESNNGPLPSGMEPFDVEEEPELRGETDLTDTDLADADAADAAEQRRLADDAQEHSYRGDLRHDVDPADAADQYREVDLDEDDYR